MVQQFHSPVILAQKQRLREKINRKLKLYKNVPYGMRKHFLEFPEVPLTRFCDMAPFVTGTPQNWNM